MIINVSGAAVDPYALAVGESMPTRALPLVVLNQTLGSMRFATMIASKTEPCASVRVWSGTTPSATLDLARIGLFQLGADGATWSLVAATANDPTLFNAASTAYTRTWIAPIRKTAGQRYGLGVLQVGAGAAGQVFGINLGLAQEAAQSPRIAGVLNGQTDLPATFADSALSSSAQFPYAALLPS